MGVHSVVEGRACLPFKTLVLRDDYELVTLMSLGRSCSIMGENGWTAVHDLWLTKERPLVEFDLSNGCSLRCSNEHKIIRGVRGKQEVIRADEAQLGDALITAGTIPTQIGEIENWSRRHGVDGAIEKLIADAGLVTYDFALQLRILCRTLGRGIRIAKDRSNMCKVALAPEPLRIERVRNAGSAFCMDLTTSTGRFWLPESDVVVRNCDGPVNVYP